MRDELIQGGMLGKMHNGIQYKDVRCVWNQANDIRRIESCI